MLRMRSGDLGDVRDIWIFRTGSGQDKRLAFQELLVEKEFNLALRGGIFGVGNTHPRKSRG